MMDSSQAQDILLDSCLQVIAQKGWSHFSFEEAARQSGEPLASYRARFEGPLDVMRALFKRIDLDMLNALGDENFADCSPQEALFEVIMSRLEASQPYKEALRTFWEARDVPGTLCLAPTGLTSANWMLERAGISTTGFRGALRIQGLMGLYLMTVQTWLKDDSPDLSKTMAFLDQGLGRLDRLGRALGVV